MSGSSKADGEKATEVGKAEGCLWFPRVGIRVGRSASMVQRVTAQSEEEMHSYVWCMG